MRNCHPAPVVLATALFAAGSVFGASYAKYASIAVPGVPDNTSLTDFPLLVRISASAPSGFSYGDFMQNDHSDLRFEDANGNGLAYDVDTWNTAGESLVWVKVPALEKDAEITMRWGSAAPDANDPTAVWSNYVFVWHGNDTSTDSTGNARSIASSDANYLARSSDEMAFLGSCFTNSTTAYKYLKVTENPFKGLSIKSKFAISGWFKPATTDPSFRVFSTKKNYADDGMELLAISDNGIYLRGMSSSKQLLWPGTNTDYGYQALKKRAWTHVAGRIDGTAGTLFTNGGKLDGEVTAPAGAGSGDWLGIGGYGHTQNTYATSMKGAMDEIRLYNGTPSDAYLVAEWAQVVSNNYTTIGAVQTTDAGAADIPDAPTVVRNQDGTYTISATFNGTAAMTYDYAFQLNGTDRATGSVTLGAAETEKTISWTTDGTVATGTYLASVTVTKGASTAMRTAVDTFLVGDLGFGTGTNAVEEGLVPGAFVLTRPGDATQPLVVAYTVASATATAGTSYEAVPVTATFAAGESSVASHVVPLNDPALRADATLTLTLSAGFYGIAQGVESMSITLVNWAAPAGYNVWIAGSGSDGLASTDANWSLGRAPVSTDAILLGAWGTASMTWDAETHTVASWRQNADYTGTVTFPITYQGANGDVGFNLFTVSGNVELQGGHWAHLVQGDSSKTETAPVERYRLNVAVGGDFSVSNGVNVSAQGRGRGFWVYNANQGWFQRGVYAGYVITTTNNMYAAESNPLFVPYGSILAPVDTGRGITVTTDNNAKPTEGHGGGAIRISVAGDFVNEGRVLANGQNSNAYTGGSGGSIFITAANIRGSGTYEANATVTTGSGSKTAASGGRVSLVATGLNAATATNAMANGTRSPDRWQTGNNPYHQGAAGTVWLASGTAKTLLVRNYMNDPNNSGFDLAPYIRAYTPIPADDDAAAFKAATATATLYAASNARIRLEESVRFAKLMVRTPAATLAHIDLHGHTLHVDSVVDTGDTAIVSSNGVYTLADAIANGWTWLEDSVGTGKLVIGEQMTLILVR